MSKPPKGGGHDNKHVPDKGQAGKRSSGHPPNKGGQKTPKDPRDK